MTLCRLEIRPYRHLLRRPVNTAKGLLTDRQGLLVEITDEEGLVGQGEAAPWDGLSPDTLDHVERALGALSAPGSGLLGLDPEQALSWLDAQGLPPSAAHALDQALLDLRAQGSGCSLAAMLTRSPRSAVPTHRLVADPYEAWEAVGQGVQCLKIKVGADTLEADLERVAEIRVAVGVDMAIRVDANGAWTPTEALRATLALAARGVGLVEDPLPPGDLVAWAELRRASPIPLAADAGCRTLADLAALIDQGAADVVVLKPMWIGGLRRAVAMAHVAAKAGLKVLVTTTFETAVGHRAAMAVARACPPGSLLPCGLDPRTSIVGPGRSYEAAIPNPLERAAASRRDHPALVGDALVHGEQCTYGELADQAARVASFLADRGVGPSHTVALAGEPSEAWVAAFFGIGWLGAIVAPVPWPRPPDELAPALTSLNPRLVLADDPASLPAGTWEAVALREARAKTPMEARDWSLDAPRVTLLTSGTTAQARSVTLRVGQLLLSAMGSTIRLGHDPGDRWLCCLPLHHVGGLAILMRAVWLGITVDLHRRFEAAHVADALDEGACSMVSLVPSMLAQILDIRGWRPFPESLRAILLGGAPAPESLLSRCRDLGAPVAVTWGLTEASSQVATRAPGDLGGADGVGAPLPFARVDVGVDGTLTIHGPLVPSSPFVTEDLGRVDASGRVHVDGRRDDVIISGGENIDPREIEGVLTQHPEVAAAAVVGRPHAHWGARPVACLVRAGRGEPRGGEDLDAWLRARLPGFKVPDALVWVAALPRTSLGKIRRSEILRRVQEAHPDEPGLEGLGDLDRTEVRQVDKCVHHLSRGPLDPVVGAQDEEPEGDRALAHAVQADLDGEALSHTHGGRVVGLRVDERHAPIAVVEDGRQGDLRRDQHLLEGDVAVLEDPAKERDSSPIHLVKAHRELLSKAHGTGPSSPDSPPAESLTGRPHHPETTR